MKHAMTLHDHVLVSTILFWLGVAIVVIGGILGKPLQPHWLMWVGLAVFLSSPLYQLLKIRCPHCGSKLLSCRTLPQYCPDCGKELH